MKPELVEKPKIQVQDYDPATGKPIGEIKDEILDKAGFEKFQKSMNAQDGED